MTWITSTLGSSVGKKLMMALTGLSFCCFLIVHLAGNLSLYGGQDFFNAYVDHLHSLGVLITFAEWGLLILALIHILTGVTLFFGNLKSRPNRYAVNKSAGGRTLGSMTMPYTGLFLLAFIIFHLFDFHFTDHTTRTVFQIVSESFSKPGYVVFYVLAVIIAAIHVSHGFWSAFQTLGLDHVKYTPLIKGVSLVFSWVLALGFGLIPIFVSIST